MGAHRDIPDVGIFGGGPESELLRETKGGTPMRNGVPPFNAELQRI